MYNLQKLKTANKALVFQDDVSRILELGRKAASVYCSRAAKRGDLLAIKRGVYLIADLAGTLGTKDLSAISNILQTPSYVSLMTALSFSEHTTQIFRSVIEAVTTMPKKSFEAGALKWNFFQIKKEYYFGFKKTDGIFVAEPEKAIVDIALLVSFGRYAADLSAISFTKFNWKQVEKFAGNFPDRTKALLKKWRNEYARA